MIDKSTVIVDNGSYQLVVGLNNDEKPQVITSSFVGHPIHCQYKFYIGDEIWSKHNLWVKSPFRDGIISDWDVMEQIWDDSFKYLNIDISEQRVIITDHLINSMYLKHCREKTIEYMFEKFGFSSFYSGFQELFSFYGSGKTTGISFNLGESTSFCVPIYDGYIIKPSVLPFHITGNKITSWLHNLLIKYNDSFNPHSLDYLFKNTKEYSIKKFVDDIKKKYTFVSLDYNSDLSKSAKYNTIIDLPDGSEETISEERFSCPEVLFQPKMNYSESDPIHKVINNSISNCQNDIQDELYKNIYLSGGSTKIPNLSKRIENEISKIAPENQQVNVKLAFDNYDAWKGASLFASMEQSQEKFISKESYEEIGSNVINNLVDFQIIYN